LTASLDAEWRFGAPVYYKLLGKTCSGPNRLKWLSRWTNRYSLSNWTSGASWRRVVVRAIQRLPLGCYRVCRCDEALAMSLMWPHVWAERPHPPHPTIFALKPVTAWVSSGVILLTKW